MKNLFIFNVAKFLLKFSDRTVVIYDLLLLREIKEHKLRSKLAKNKSSSKTYESYVKENEGTLLTRNQSHFAQFLFDNEEELTKTGDFNKVFESVYKYLKN